MPAKCVLFYYSKSRFVGKARYVTSKYFVVVTHSVSCIGLWTSPPHKTGVGMVGAALTRPLLLCHGVVQGRVSVLYIVNYASMLCCLSTLEGLNKAAFGGKCSVRFFLPGLRSGLCAMRVGLCPSFLLLR